MTYVVPTTLKKNSLSTTIAAPGIAAGDTTIPIADCSVAYDANGTLMTTGWVIGYNQSTISPEEVTVSACSVPYGTGGAGTLTVVRAVNYDVNTGGAAQGAAYAWPTGTRIAPMFSIGIYNVLINDLIALKALTGAWASYSPTLTWGGTPPTITSSVFRYVRNGDVVTVSGYIVFSNGNGATSLTVTLPVAANQIANFKQYLTGTKSITSGGNTLQSDPFAFVNLTLATPDIQFDQFGTLPAGYTGFLAFNGSYEVNT